MHHRECSRPKPLKRSLSGIASGDRIPHPDDAPDAWDVTLALATGWTESALDRMTVRFRAACHWLLYARAICGPDGLPPWPEIPKGGSPEAKYAVVEMQKRIRDVERVLFPEDE